MLWSLFKASPLYLFQPVQAAPCLCWSASGQRLAVIGGSGLEGQAALHIWSAETNTAALAMQGLSWQCGSFSSDGRFFLMHASDGSWAGILDAASWQLLFADTVSNPLTLLTRSCEPPTWSDMSADMVAHLPLQQLKLAFRQVTGPKTRFGRPISAAQCQPGTWTQTSTAHTGRSSSQSSACGTQGWWKQTSGQACWHLVWIKWTTPAQAPSSSTSSQLKALPQELQLRVFRIGILLWQPVQPTSRS